MLIFFIPPGILLSKASYNLVLIVLTHFTPMFHFYTPNKRQRTFGFRMFSGDAKMEHWAKMGENNKC